MLLTNRQEISAYFVVPCSFFSVWAMNKYCTVAVCRSGSKKRPNLNNYCCFPVKSDDRKKWEVLCMQAGKKFKKLIDPRIYSLHFKETDIAISIFGRKNITSACYSNIFIPLQKRRIRAVRAQSILIIERGVVLKSQKPSRAKHSDFAEQIPRKKNSRLESHIQSKTYRPRYPETLIMITPSEIKF